jgi:transcriptional regulator with XRE-family HTH domain
LWRIRQRRLELGLTQRELGGPGTSGSFVSRIESGHRDPSVKAPRKLAAKLDVSTYWLETGEEDPAIDLAQLVLEHQPMLPPRARRLAEAILRSTPRGSEAR